MKSQSFVTKTSYFYSIINDLQTAWLNVIVHKTELAIAELSATKRSLSMLDRRILLFTDGIRSIDQIRALVNTPDSGELIYLLEKKGFLSQNKPKTLPSHAPVNSVVDEFLAQIRPLIVPIANNSLFSKLIAPALNAKQHNATVISAKPIIANPIQTEANTPALAENIVRIEQPTPIQDYTVDEQTKAAIKRIITDTCNEHLGIFSRELVDKTQLAQDAKQLRVCISQWHMAMQESKTGREHCFDWLNEVNELLLHGAAQELKSA